MSKSAPKRAPTERERLAAIDDLFMWVLTTCSDDAERRRMLAIKRAAIQLVRDKVFEEEEVEEVLIACGIDPADD